MYSRVISGSHGNHMVMMLLDTMTNIITSSNTGIIHTGEILSSQTYVTGHVLLLNSLDWTNTGVSFILLAVNL